jgi:hypothetical protein
VTELPKTKIVNPPHVGNEKEFSLISPSLLMSQVCTFGVSFLL